MMTIRNLIKIGLTASFISSTGFAQSYNVQEYWLMPNGVVGEKTQLLNGVTTYGHHTFWSGWAWGKYVMLQGDPSMATYDAHEYNGTDLMYIGTFRGNMQTAQQSSFFLQPIKWMPQTMSIGQYVDTTHQYYKTAPKNREQTGTPQMNTARIQLVNHYDSYKVPETGQVYSDVIEIKYWFNLNNPNLYEHYWCARNKGYVRSIEYTASGTKYTWITNFLYGQSVNFPQTSWYSLWSSPVSFQGGNHNTYVYNGAFENSANHLTGWQLSSSDCAATTEGSIPPTETPWWQADPNNPNYDENGAWKACLRGYTGGGDGNPDAITSWYVIPVTPGKTYTLKAWIWRVSGNDNAYIDFADGAGWNQYGQPVTFTDVSVAASSTNQWERKSVDFTVPWYVYGVKVRCVRDGANEGNAYFDDVRLVVKP